MVYLGLQQLVSTHRAGGGGKYSTGLKPKLCKSSMRTSNIGEGLLFWSFIQVRIQDLVKGRSQLLRPKIADVAKRSRASEASNLWPGSRALKRALEAFGFLMHKYAFSHILETLFLSFLTSILTPNVDKNRALEFTSINLRHSYILHLFF